MKKYSILLAVSALLLSSLACKTIMGGGNSGAQNPSDSGGVATQPPSTDGGNINVGGDSPFPVTSDASNVISTPQTVTYQTKMSADDVMKFYRDEFGKKGYTEDKSLTTNLAGTLAMFFKDDKGKTIVLGGVPSGDGGMTVSLAYQQ